MADVVFFFFFPPGEHLQFKSIAKDGGKKEEGKKGVRAEERLGGIGGKKADSWERATYELNKKKRMMKSEERRGGRRRRRESLGEVLSPESDSGFPRQIPVPLALWNVSLSPHQTSFYTDFCPGWSRRGCGSGDAKRRSCRFKSDNLGGGPWGGGGVARRWAKAVILKWS